MKRAPKLEHAAAIGGAFVIDPSSGGVERRLVPDMPVRALAASPDGRELFAVQDWPNPAAVRFARVDVATGAVRADTVLRPNTAPTMLEEQWTLAVVNMPTSLIPRGEVHPKPCG